MNQGVVYSISFGPNSKLYIGSAIDFKRRRWDHMKLLRRGTHPNIHLQRAFSKYGESLVEFITLEEGLKNSDVILREQYWIDQYDYLKDLYNLCPTAGSSFGRKASEETRQKMSRNRGRYCGEDNNFFGKTHTEEVKALIALKATGRKQSVSTIEKRVGSIISNYGRHPNSKQVNQLDAKTGEVIKTWESMTEASKALGIGVANISTVANKIPVFHKNKGKSYTTKTAGGFKWEILDSG